MKWITESTRRILTLSQFIRSFFLFFYGNCLGNDELRQPNYPNWIQLRICQTCPNSEDSTKSVESSKLTQRRHSEVLTQPSLPRVVPSGHQLSLNVAESPGRWSQRLINHDSSRSEMKLGISYKLYKLYWLQNASIARLFPPSLCHSCSHTPVASGIKGWGNSDVIKLHKLHWLNEKYPNSYLLPVLGWNLAHFHCCLKFHNFAHHLWFKISIVCWSNGQTLTFAKPLALVLVDLVDSTQNFLPISIPCLLSGSSQSFRSVGSTSCVV